MMPEVPSYRGLTLPDEPDIDQCQAIVPEYTAMLLSIVRVLADRFDRHPDYPFVDTKLDLLSGEDFPDDDPIRGKETIYGWIQGRALESLAGHHQWIQREGLDPELLPRLRRMMRDLLDQVRRMRQRNKGRFFFFMAPDGTPFRLSPEGERAFFEPDPDLPFGFSDLFCAKGMLAAAHLLKDRESFEEAISYCLEVDQAIWEENFRNDQEPLDPESPIEEVPGKRFHGPYMIQIGAAALLASTQADPDCVERGLRLIQHELDYHANLGGRIPDLEECDFWEAIDEQGLPFREKDGILCDPGHALEFVGLALKFTRTIRRLGLATPGQTDRIEKVEAAMTPLLEHLFQLGFQPGPGGICKSFDLIGRKPVNADMPWWNLPETMRAAGYCWQISRDPGCLRVLAACHNAFVQHYVRPEIHLMAVQTRDAKGRPVPVIPACADADPGYHTGLSIIDLLDLLKERK